MPTKCWSSHLDYKLNINSNLVGFDGYTEEEVYKQLMMKKVPEDNITNIIS